MSESSEPEINDSTPIDQVRAWGQRNAERANANAEAAGRVPRLERENALLRAGGNPDSRVGRLLLGDDDVDWSDRAAVTAAWTEVSPPPATPAPPADTEPPDAEAIARQQRRDDLANGNTPPGEEPSPHPWTEASGIFHEAQRKGRNRDRASAPALDHVLQAAVAGDKRVIFDPKVPYSEQYEPL
jgi:hypothetical protein